MAAFGLVEDVPDDDAPLPEKTFYLWPDNLWVWGLWQRIQTHWRVGMNGREGLATNDLCAYLREVERIKPRALVQTYPALQAMEIASLNAWAKQREKQNNKA